MKRILFIGLSFILISCNIACSNKNAVEKHFDFQEIGKQLLNKSESEIFQLLELNQDIFTRSEFGEGRYAFESNEDVITLYGKKGRLYMEFDSESTMYACYWRCYYNPEEFGDAFDTACQVVEEFDYIYEEEPMAIPQTTLRGQFSNYEEFEASLLSSPSLNIHGTYWKCENDYNRDLRFVINKDQNAVLIVGYGNVAGQ